MAKEGTAMKRIVQERRWATPTKLASAALLLAALVCAVSVSGRDGLQSMRKMEALQFAELSGGDV